MRGALFDLHVFQRLVTGLRAAGVDGWVEAMAWLPDLPTAMARLPGGRKCTGDYD